MSANDRSKNKVRRAEKGEIELVPLTRKEMERSVTGTLLKDSEVVVRIEGQLDEIAHEWKQMGITPLVMVYLAVQLQELSVMIYREGYMEFTTGMFGKLSKKNKAVFVKDFENMCRAIKKRGSNAMISRLKKEKLECGKSSNSGTSQKSTDGDESATYIASKERPCYIY